MKNINVLSFAKFQMLFALLIGSLAGIIYSFGGLLVDTLVSLGWITTDETPGLSYGTILAFGALVGMPLIAAFWGFIFGILEALMYNAIAKWFPIKPFKFQERA